MSFAIVQKWNNPLLRKPRLVREDVFIQGLSPDETKMICSAMAKGLTPSGFKVVEDTLILRLDLRED
jgi:hypothetical protein